MDSNSVDKNSKVRLLPNRQAKQSGEVSRQLTSFIDNQQSSASSSVSTKPTTVSIHDEVMIASQSSADAESWSSISPPDAPAPPPFVVNESINTSGNAVVQMLEEREKLQQQLAELNQRIEHHSLNWSKQCWLLLSIDRIICEEQVIIELFNDTSPRTCEIFRSICSSSCGFNYENSSFDYIVPNQYIKGGTIEAYSSDGKKVSDKSSANEFSSRRHDRKGLITMDLTNGHNQFIVTLGRPISAAPTLDDQYVVFGEIIHGGEIFDSINSYGVRGLLDVNEGGQPLHSISMVSCGVI